MSGGKTVEQLLTEASAHVPFIAMAELAERVNRNDLGLILLDVREKDAFDAGHIPGARHLPRGQLGAAGQHRTARSDPADSGGCEFGHISTLAAATLRELGYTQAAALDGGIKAWRESGLPMTTM